MSPMTVLVFGLLLIWFAWTGRAEALAKVIWGGTKGTASGSNSGI